MAAGEDVRNDAGAVNDSGESLNDLETKPGRLERWVPWMSGLVLVFFTAYASVRPFRSHQNWMIFVEDDFFYYLKVAQNIVAGHGSTFNGIVSTNGYHPLWMIAVLGAVFLGAKNEGILLFVALSSWIATVAMYFLSFRLLRQAKVEAVLGSLIAAYIGVFSFHLFQYGMEVTLATPLMMGLLVVVQGLDGWDRKGAADWWRWLGVGLLISATVLARLDTIIFVAMLFVALAANRELRLRVHAGELAWLVVGMLPIGAYFIYNHLRFGVYLPISGMSKQLKLDHGFTALAWNGLLQGSRMQKVHLVPIFLALAVLPWMWRRLEPGTRALAVVTLAYPFVYTAVLSWESDWPLWLWYFYDLRPALCVALLILLQITVVARVAAKPQVLVLTAVMVLGSMVIMRWNEQFSSIVAAAADLQEFTKTHHGRYAMGDRSGAVGIMVSDPLVQTEGLMMDRAFLEQIRHQTPLRQVLATYGVRYYVGSALKSYNGCFEAEEPQQGGPHTPKMRGEFCEEPVAQWTEDGVKTMVFDLQVRQEGADSNYAQQDPQCAAAAQSQ